MSNSNIYSDLSTESKLDLLIRIDHNGHKNKRDCTKDFVFNCMRLSYKAYLFHYYDWPTFLNTCVVLCVVLDDIVGGTVTGLPVYP